MEKEYISIPELAKALGISRIAVYKKVKKGEIEAIRIGKNYAISIKEISKKELKTKDKEEIDRAVKKTIKEYGETLKLLGNN